MRGARSSKIILWMVFIGAVLFVGLETELSSPHKYLIIGAAFLICVGLFAAIVKRDKR